LKASVFLGARHLEVREVPVPAVAPDGMLVKVMACGICGSDIRNFVAGLRGGVSEQTMGHEIAGIVEQTGGDVQDYLPGDRVAVAPDVSCGGCIYCRQGLVNLCQNHRMLGTHWPGGFAQYVYLPGEVLRHGMVSRIPGHLKYGAATLAEPLSSVIAAQENANVQLGETVVVIGDGPIGCMHVEIARARGASKVILVGLSRLRFAREFVPDLLIDAASQDPVKAVLTATEGLGADVIITALPVAAAQAQAVQMARKRGRVVLFGGLPKDKPHTTLDGNRIHYDEIVVMGAFSYTLETNRKAIAAIANGLIQPDRYITHVVGLDEIPEGIDAAQSGKAVKLVVDPWR